MNLEKRIASLVYLGKQIELKDEELLGVQNFAKHKNNWFTIDNSDFALNQIANNFLQKEKLEAWAKHNNSPDLPHSKSIAIILSGSSPLANFHDLVAAFLMGFKIKIKLSEDDKYLIPHLIKIIKEIFPEVENFISFSERLQDFDGIISNGNYDSIKTFETYFSKFPNLIRKFRTGIAVLSGKESKENLAKLGLDIFQYFGLSNRNVSKIYVPEDYDFVPLLEATHEFNQIVLTNKYKNNFDYNYTLQIVNNVKYKANGCLMILENEALQSRVATLHFEIYKDENHLKTLLENKKLEIQHIISNNTFPNFKNKSFGTANDLDLMDYEKGMAFLKTMNVQH